MGRTGKGSQYQQKHDSSQRPCRDRILRAITCIIKIFLRAITDIIKSSWEQLQVSLKVPKSNNVYC